MIFEDLYLAYNKLVERGVFEGDAWCRKNVSYAIDLTAEGEITGISDIRELNSKGKPIPRTLSVPAAPKRSGSIPKPYFLCDNGKYICGIGEKGKTDKKTAEEAEKARECYFATGRRHRQLLEGVRGKTAAAVANYFSSWTPGRSEAFAVDWDDLNKANVTFRVDGVLAIEDPDIRKAWEDHCWTEKERRAATESALCTVTGKRDIPALIHQNISGVPDALPTGASLVNFNFDTAEAYGFHQGETAHIGQEAMIAYTSTLSYMEKSMEYHRNIHGMSLCYWTDELDSEHQKILRALIDPFMMDEEEKNLTLRLLNGDMDEPSGIMNATCHLALISANGPRISLVRYRTIPFTDILTCVRTYWKRTWVNQERENFYFPASMMMAETVNAKAKGYPEKELTAALLFHILCGEKAPGKFPIVIKGRIFKDGTVNGARAAAVRFGLIEEGVIMDNELISLDKNEASPGYLLGQVLAVASIVEQRSQPDVKIARTVKDLYFERLMQNPQYILPKLHRQTCRYIRRMKRISEDAAKRYEREVAELIEKLTAIPETLSSREQSLYILSCYQRIQAQYRRSTKEENPAETKGEGVNEE